MKTPSLLSTLTFLAFGFAAFSFPGPVSSQITTSSFTGHVSSQTTILPEKVYDILGGQLQAGAKYNVLQYPIVEEVNTSCDDVVLASLKTFSITFVPFNINSTADPFIYTGLDLNLKFLSNNGCYKKSSTTVWTLDNEWSVIAGGIEGNYGPQTWANWFQIVKVNGDTTTENLYSFRFCPSFAGQIRCKCSNVGIVERDGVKHLALTETPLLVVFERIDLLNAAFA